MMITADNLSKRYGDHVALNNVSFQIDAGASVALWGSNGAGKTTALRCLLGLHAFEGRVSVNGIDVARQARRARAAIGYVPQEASFYDMSVQDTMLFYARLKKAPLEHVDSALEQVQMVPHRDKSTRALSGGMKQRLALGVALLGDPPILVLDEPTASLDVRAQNDLVQMVQALNHGGKTVVFSSHRMDEVIALASRVLVLRDGALAHDCPPGELAATLGMHQWLRIWVPAEARGRTERLLEGHGFAFAPNGRSVYVRLGAGGKMHALRLLEAASIHVEDFDLVEGSFQATEQRANGHE